MWRQLVFMHYIVFASQAFQTSQSNSKTLSKQLRDLTDPINALIKGKISTSDFFATSGFTENGTETKTKLNLYTPDCKKIEDCVKEINKVCKFWNDTLGRDIKLDLTMSLWFSKNTISELSKAIQPNGESTRPDFETKYLVNIEETTTCEDLNNVPSRDWTNLAEFAEWDYGIGLSEGLILCKVAMEKIYYREWSVIYIKFGDTNGVPESFGIFRKLMAYLHAQIVTVVAQFSPHYSKLLPEIWYYPIVKSGEDIQNKILLEKYMKIWQDHRIDGADLIFKSNLPSYEMENSDTFSKFTVVPFIKYGRSPWYAPSSVREISRRFNYLIMEYDQWKFWNSDTRKELYNNINYKPIDTQIGVILDYSYATENGLVDVNGNSIQETLEEFQDIRGRNTEEPFLLKTILFKINKSESDEYSTNVDAAIVQQIISVGVTVGCTLVPEFLNKSAAAALVTACQKINGTLYVLTLPEIGLNTNIAKPLYYNYAVRKSLESAKKFRASILKFQTNADVYFELPITSNVDIRERYYARVTVFCNEYILNVNEYHEAIINWAKFNDFPVILKSVTDTLEYPDYSSWLSFLRPEFSDVSEEFHSNVAEIHPSLVLRNYPNDINNWTIDPCITWTTLRPEIGVEYFHNEYIGCIFDTRHIRQDESIKNDEYEMLLNFISYRFNSAEITLSNNWQDFITTCKQITTKLWNGPEKDYLINYVFPESKKSPVYKLTQSAEFLKFLSEIPNKGECAVQGVHMDLSTYDVQKFLLDTRIVQNLIKKGLELDIKIGILFNSTACMEAFQLILFQNISKTHILSSLNYLVCKEKHLLTGLGDVNVIGNVLDTHLYLKRVLTEFLPNLNVYFRIEVDVVLDEDKVVMEQYLRLISHLKQFGKAYDISYFVVQSFDDENGRKNGWWTTTNYTNLSNPFTYVEKESVYAGRQMWWPAPLIKRPKLAQIEDFKIPVTVIVAIVIVTFFVIGLIIFSFVLYMRYKKVSQFLSDEEVKEFLNGRSKKIEDSCQQNTDICVSPDYMKFQQNYNLQLADFYIDQQCLLGTGNFGVVYKGIAKGIPAAIKQPNKNCSKTSFKSFLEEIKVHCYIGIHTNIVGFLGAYTKEIHKGTLLIATELCPNGSLEGYLRRQNTVHSRLGENDYVNSLRTVGAENVIELLDLYRFSLEIASGMDYLEKKQVVHGDLSTRNVLLNENYTCKIGDFGLSRKLYEYQKYVKKSQEPLPWKWMAYESLTKMEFTSKSDVWSYGVTLWEIFSLGKVPYGATNWTLEFPDELQKGLRLGKPEFSSDQMYLVNSFNQYYGKLLDCWNLDIEARPKFNELVEFFQEIGNVHYTILRE